MHTLKLPAKIEHLSQWRQFITQRAQAQGVSSKHLQRIELALEEALVNVCHYAYPSAPGEVEVVCTVDAQQRFIIEIVDRGIPFDPLSLPPPMFEDDLAHRRIGGLGVFLIRHLADEVAYRREDGRNILQLVVYQPQDA